MAEFNPDITLQEFELLRIAVEGAVENARRYVQDAPNDEDEMAENLALIEWISLQEKFPPMDFIHFVGDPGPGLPPTDPTSGQE